MNAALAVKTIQVLEDQIPVSLEALKAGMAKHAGREGWNGSSGCDRGWRT